MLASPALGIKPGYSYTVGFDAYCTGAPRTLNVDVYNGTIDTAGSAVTLTNTSTHYSFTESNSDASMPSAWLRVFCTTQGSDVVVSNVKVAIGAKDTAWCDNVITKANISTFMQAAAIGLAFIDTASIGQLSALSAYLGAVDIGPNGHIASGQTDYNVGNGLWIGGSNAPRMSMRTANGNTFLCDPANNVLSMNGGTVYGTVISGGMVSGTTSLPKPSVTGTGPITSTGANGNRSWNLSVSASGGSGTFTYSWVFGGGTDSVFRMSGNTSSSAVTVSVSGTNNEYYALCICVVTDSNGLSSYFSVSIDARFGTPV